MSSTSAQIIKVKQELQRLRSEYLKAADDQSRHALAFQIKRRKELLRELGVEHG